MPVLRFPVVAWEDREGGWTAIPLDSPEGAALASTRDAAVEQVRAWLQAGFDDNPWRDGPALREPKITTVKVQVRPEVVIDERAWPAERPLRLSVAVVCTRDACVIPTLDVRFFFQDARALKELVAHYVQERLRGLAPGDLSRRLPPSALHLDEVSVKASRRLTLRATPPVLGALRVVADPLVWSGARKTYPAAWRREVDVAELQKRVRHENASVILVGPPGVGKTAVLVAAARTEESGGPRFWLTSGARMIAGMQYLGEWQERCERTVDDLARIDGVLCVEDLLGLVRAGGAPEESVAAFLAPYLERGEMRMVAEATPDELDACRRLLPGFVDLFQVLRVPELSGEAARDVLQRIAAAEGRRLRKDDAEEMAAPVERLFRRFQPYRAFPGAAATFLRKLLDSGKGDPLEAFADATGLPTSLLRDEDALAREDVVEWFRGRVLRQEAACQAAADVVIGFKAGLNDPKRPLGVLLLAGPTGVGKTEMARALASYLFGRRESEWADDRLVRLDMSEYAGPLAATRLFEGADGAPGEMIRRLRAQPFCVVLLDEIEKADASIYDVLLSVLDEGRLTDRDGRVTWFRSAVVVMTTNLGAGGQSLGFQKRESGGEGEVTAFFRPEFVNRLDAVVRFNALDETAARAITVRELRALQEREGLRRARLRLEWSDALVDWLAGQGFDPRYGARPLQRTLEALVVAPLARWMVAHPLARDRVITLDFQAGGIRLADTPDGPIPIAGAPVRAGKSVGRPGSGSGNNSRQDPIR